MFESSLGKILPNIRVESNTECVDSLSVIAEPVTISNKDVDVHPNMDFFQNSKTYKNKDGGFETGIDLLAQELSGVLDKRAQRFGIDKKEDKSSLSSLYESMGIDIKDRNSAYMKTLRLDALHVRGVNDLNTEEVFNYFRDYGPESIEWINDTSCNIRYIDEASAARALLGLSKPLPITSTAKSPDSEDKEPEAEDKLMDIDPTDHSESQLLPPMPPGNWRLGVHVPHSKAENILMRFATKEDKKLPGAEKRSTYYKKYGNPNYGGLKGLISTSRKYKVQSVANKSVIESSFSKTSLSNPKSVSSSRMGTKKKKITMTMYADAEEERIKRKRLNKSASETCSVHERLGKKYTIDHADFEDNNFDTNPQESYIVENCDLRKKLKEKSSCSNSYSPDTGFHINRNYKRNEPFNFPRINELKQETKGYYKRKHRSPLCDDESDYDDSGSESA